MVRISVLIFRDVKKCHLDAQEAPESNSAVMLFRSSVSPVTWERNRMNLNSNSKIQDLSANHQQIKDIIRFTESWYWSHRWELLWVVRVDFVLVMVVCFMVRQSPNKIHSHRWELLRVMRVDVVLAAHCHCQADVAAVGQKICQTNSSPFIFILTFKLEGISQTWKCPPFPHWARRWLSQSTEDISNCCTHQPHEMFREL